MVVAGTVREEIELTGKQFGDAFNRGDAAGVAALYAEDAMLLPPGSAPVKGRRAIQEFWQGARDMGVQEIELTTEEVDSRIDLAYEVGSATLRIKTEDGPPITDTVKFVVVWKRPTGGPWQLYRDIWNSNV